MGQADEAFRQLVTRRGPALLRTAFLLTGDLASAEDLVQAALTQTYAAWGRLREPAAAEGYVRRTMATTYVSWWRRHRRERVTDAVPEPAVSTRDADADLQTVLARSVLWPLLARLPRGQRAVLVLRYYEDLSEAETARQLGCTVGTVKSQASRALARLRTELQRSTPDPDGSLSVLHDSREV
jgi:RNA polymerase sigma-70 factor (sigma-E family)